MDVRYVEMNGEKQITLRESVQVKNYNSYLLSIYIHREHGKENNNVDLALKPKNIFSMKKEKLFSKDSHQSND
ncbi:hypothetical protein DERP_005583 [Dermatophagoides pteronyssinus]|uniref:Uncharacterized protein n=1 Tax=Dermatophagoides pteronyssinus TaxID=6956 RepID=A0ABQ8J9P1_DERPT|nr:hypothetical protein DERP_005583 [Dermatophagoides pteronyssinus]